VQAIRRLLNLRRYGFCGHCFAPFKVTRQRQRVLSQYCRAAETVPREQQRFLPARRIEASIDVHNHRRARRTRWLVRACSRRSRSEYPCRALQASVHRSGTTFHREGSERVFRTLGWSTVKSLEPPAVSPAETNVPEVRKAHNEAFVPESGTVVRTLPE
jgi:hypothetical protein